MSSVNNSPLYKISFYYNNRETKLYSNLVEKKRKQIEWIKNHAHRYEIFEFGSKFYKIEAYVQEMDLVHMQLTDLRFNDCNIVKCELPN